MKPKRNRFGRVAFLAKIENVKKMIGEGYSLTAIYEKDPGLKNKMNYVSFTNYVKRYITKVDNKQLISASQIKASPPLAKKEIKPGFEYNPANYKKEDLI